MIFLYHFLFAQSRWVLVAVFCNLYFSIIAMFMCSNRRSYNNLTFTILDAVCFALYFNQSPIIKPFPFTISKLWTKELTFDFSTFVLHHCIQSAQQRNVLAQLYPPSPPAPELTPAATPAFFFVFRFAFFFNKSFLHFRAHYLFSNTHLLLAPPWPFSATYATYHLRYFISRPIIFM